MQDCRNTEIKNILGQIHRGREWTIKTHCDPLLLLITCKRNINKHNFINLLLCYLNPLATINYLKQLDIANFTIF